MADNPTAGATMMEELRSLCTKSDFLLLSVLPKSKKLKVWFLDSNSLTEFWFVDFLGRQSFRFKVSCHEMNLPSFLSEQVTIWPYTNSDAQYAAAFEQIQTIILNGKIEKLVLSRIWEEAFNSVDALNLFLELSQVYKNHALYWLRHSEIGEWMGASPELLLKKDGKRIFTHALAGTLGLQNGPFGAKEKEEHLMVSRFIKETFLNWGASQIELVGPYEWETGKIKHLKTDISADYAGNELDILLALHPSPAVSGLPKQEAITAIQNIEKHNRAFYTGFFGWKQPEHSEFFVNLRCLEMHQNKVRFYVGGGITAQSQLHREFEETEEKRMALYPYWKKHAY